MKIKLLGDTQKIDWEALGVKMPFAPMHKLAEKYELTEPFGYGTYDINLLQCTLQQFHTVFETKGNENLLNTVFNRIKHRTYNTIAALDQCTSDTVCINLGGGFHHAGKYPNTGYAYSLINDIVWAVDYQLEQNPSIRIGIIDLDFHFGGGTWEYYVKNHNPHIYISDLFHKQGVLHQHQYLVEEDFGLEALEVPYLDNMAVDKVILNIGTDWYQDDILFGKYGSMCSADLIDVWWNTVRQITVQGIPVCVTMGGGYGTAGLMLYEEFISGLELMRV